MLCPPRSPKAPVRTGEMPYRFHHAHNGSATCFQHARRLQGTRHPALSQQGASLAGQHQAQCCCRPSRGALLTPCSRRGSHCHARELQGCLPRGHCQIPPQPRCRSPCPASCRPGLPEPAQGHHVMLRHCPSVGSFLWGRLGSGFRVDPPAFRGTLPDTPTMQRVTDVAGPRAVR